MTPVDTQLALLVAKVEYLTSLTETLVKLLTGEEDQEPAPVVHSGDTGLD